jgi:hypothetical protein
MIEQHPEESAKAWKAYCCYQNLGPLRSLSLAYAIYKGSEETTAKPSASFIRWKSEFKWDDRVKLWDASEEEKARDRQRGIDDEVYMSELERFREAQLEAGKIGVAIVLNLKQKLLDWVENHPKIESFSDALTVARIIMAIEMASSEQWAKALHIDLLLQRMDEEEQFED